MSFAGKRYWLIGASEGLGAALALQLSQAGAEVLLSARSEERLTALAATLPGPATVLPCDVAHSDSVEAAATKAGQIDGMIWLAGVYWPMRAQKLDARQAEAMADINFTGAIRAVSSVLPQMIARGTGHIVITGSLSGFRACPAQSVMRRRKRAAWCWQKAFTPICVAQACMCNSPTPASSRPG